MRIHIHRFEPHQDLKDSLLAFATRLQINAGFIVSCVGSVRQVSLRLAGSDSILVQDGPFEIVSLVGTLSQDGCHLHASFSDTEGRVVGGHLLSGCPIFTTAEVVIGESKSHRFDRQLDPHTGFDELVVYTESNQAAQCANINSENKRRGD